MSNVYKNSKYEIVVAKIDHLDDIYKLARSYALSNFKSPKHASEGSFFVSDFSRQTYENLILEDHIFWIIEESGEFRAFLLAIDPVKRKLDKTLDKKIKEWGSGEYILIKQICTQPEHISKGIASLLYRALIEKYHKFSLVTAIVANPPNPRSIAFHKKFGFKCAFKYTALDRLARTIWIRAKGR